MYAYTLIMTDHDGNPRNQLIGVYASIPAALDALDHLYETSVLTTMHRSGEDVNRDFYIYGYLWEADSDYGQFTFRLTYSPIIEQKRPLAKYSTEELLTRYWKIGAGHIMFPRKGDHQEAVILHAELLHRGCDYITNPFCECGADH